MYVHFSETVSYHQIRKTVRVTDPKTLQINCKNLLPLLPLKLHILWLHADVSEVHFITEFKQKDLLYHIIYVPFVSRLQNQM